MKQLFPQLLELPVFGGRQERARTCHNFLSFTSVPVAGSGTLVRTADLVRSPRGPEEAG